jgi:hypothetical protein
MSEKMRSSGAATVRTRSRRDPPQAPAGPLKTLTASEAIEKIKAARKDGRTIIPLIGAGLSAESGIPTTALLVDYFAKVRELIYLKHLRRGTSQEPPLPSIYHDYLIKAGWPDVHDVNAELLAAYRRDGRSKQKDVQEWVESLREEFAEPAGNPLEGIRLRVIHELLRREQHMLVGIFSTEKGEGKCPVVGAIDSMSESFVSVLKDYATSEFASYLTSRNGAEDSQSSLEAVINGFLQKGIRPDRLREKLTPEMKKLRGRALLNLRIDWRALMRALTSGIPALADSLFDQLVRDGNPSYGHQFLALLTESLGWNLWLTTNFDTLIEDALRDQGIRPVVFELPENGPVPNASLLRGGPSVVKLHGGAFALRVGESLDVPLDEANLGLFSEYFPEDALVLVLGYGGADSRVMSLLEFHASRPKQEGKDAIPLILWVYRDNIHDNVTRLARLGRSEERVCVVQYRSGGLFLRELHARLVCMHPASRNHYPSLPMVAPFQRARKEANAQCPIAAETKGKTSTRHQQAESVRPNPSVTIYASSEAGSGTTSSLAEHVRNIDGSHQSVWCELAEMPTLQAAVAMLLDEIRRYDPGITPRTVVPPGEEENRDQLRKDVLAALKKAPPSGFAEAFRRAKQITRPLASQVMTAMRRGKYVIGLNSSGEFGRHELAHDVDDDGFARHTDDALWQTLLLYSFLTHFFTRERQSGVPLGLGESKLCVALTPLETAKAGPFASSLFHYFLDKIPKDVRQPPTRRGDNGRDLRSTTAMLEMLVKEKREQEKKEKREQEKSASVELSSYQGLLAIASAFRRPRSHVNLRRLADEFSIFGSTQSQHRDKYFDEMVSDLDNARLLVHLEGGFYWMHSHTRNEIYRSVKQGDFVLGDKTIADLHKEIADEYTDLLRQSKSLPAIYEAVYHLITACQLSRDAGEDYGAKYIRAIYALVGRYKKILEGGPPSRVIGWANALDIQLDTFEQSLMRVAREAGAEIRGLQDLLREIRARLLFTSTEFDASLRVWKQQLGSFISSGRGLRPLRKIRRAALSKEKGDCFARLRKHKDADRSFEHGFQVLETIAKPKSTGATNGVRTEDEFRAREFRAQAVKIQILCRLGQSQNALDQIHPWKWKRRTGFEKFTMPPTDADNLQKSKSRFDEADKLLDQNADLVSRDFSGLHVAKALQEARVRTFYQDFPRAQRALDNAQAAVLGGAQGGDFGDLTDIRLQTAMTQIISAALDAGGGELPETVVGSPSAAKEAGITPKDLRPRVKAKLDRAEVALDQARSTLLRGRPDVGRWARLGLLQAFLQLERLLFHAWEIKSDNTDSATLDSPYETLIQHGLKELGDVRKLCWSDRVRQEETLLLWLRLLASFRFFRRHFEPSESSQESLDVWLRWNDQAELQFFSEKRTIKSFCRGYLSDGRQAPGQQPAGEPSPETLTSADYRKDLVDKYNLIQDDVSKLLRSLRASS